jgi:hypothetical protein
MKKNVELISTSLKDLNFGKVRNAEQTFFDLYIEVNLMRSKVLFLSYQLKENQRDLLDTFSLK